MRRCSAITAVALGLLSTVAIGRAQPVSAGKPNFSGVWTLNRDLSDKASQVESGAGVSGQRGDQNDAAKSAARGDFDRVTSRGRSDARGDGGYRGERTGRAAVTGEPRSSIELLVRELRNPSPSLTISHAGSTLTVTNAADRTRLFQINGQKDPHQVGDATVLSSSRWDGNRLVTDYDLGGGRTVRITYSIVPDTKQLLEQVSFANGQTIKRIYDPARPAKRP
jgi:hypothetical protein